MESITIVTRRRRQFAKARAAASLALIKEATGGNPLVPQRELLSAALDQLLRAATELDRSLGEAP